MNIERALYLAGRAIGELIYCSEGCDADEMREWCKNEFELTEDEMEELGIN